MSDLTTIRTALLECYSDFEALCDDLSDADWRARSLCPDWNVRDVVSHVVSIEVALSGWRPTDATTPPPFERAGKFVMAATSLDTATLASRVRAVFAERRADLAALSVEDLARPSWTPVGPGTLGRFLDVRVFDFWVHERDITVPLGRATDDTGPCAEIALGEVEGSLGYIVGKKIGLPDGASLAFHLTGPLSRDLFVEVDGRARRVERVESPDVEVTTDSLTFLLLACGRIDPQGPIDDGRITWSGDNELGERAARSLRFTM